MEFAATPRPLCFSILHQTPGRIRFHVAEGSPLSPAGVESALRRFVGVRQVRTNARTRNVLVTFDPQRLTPADLLRGLQGATLAPAPATCGRPTAHSSDRSALASRPPQRRTVSSPITPSHSSTSSPEHRAATLAAAVEVLQRLQSRPTLRNHFRDGLNEVLGKGVVDLLFATAGLLSELVAGGPLGLLLTVIEGLFMLAERLAEPATDSLVIPSIDPSLN